MHIARVMLVAVLGLFLAAPGAQTAFRFAREVRLFGVVAPQVPPMLSVRSWWSGEFQKAASAWFDARIGFRGHAVRTDNQIGYSVFREASSMSADRPVLGRDNIVFEKAYIDAYNGRSSQPDASLRKLAGRLRTLQDGLQRRGIAFALVIAPSKAAVYPEALPPRHVVSAERRPPTDYDRLRPMLDEAGVNMVDGRRIFEAQARQSPVRLFPPAGIHWNRYGAGLVVSAVWSELERQSGRPMVRLRVAGIDEDDDPSVGDAETDVVRMMNLWRFGNSSWKHVHVDHEVEAPPDVFRPRVLVVGDSFGWLMMSVVRRHKMADGAEFLYYFSQRNRKVGDGLEPFDRAALDWEREILSADAIVVLANEIMISGAGFGFVRAACDALEQTQPAAPGRL